MSRKNKTIVIIIVILVIIFLWNLTVKKPVTKTNISDLSSAKIGILKQKTAKKVLADKEPIEIQIEVVEINIDELDINPDLTFLSAFREFTFFLMCETTILDIKKNKNPLEHYTQRASYLEKYGIEITHENYFLEHIEKCESILTVKQETYQYAHARLKKTYQSIKPKTEEELDLYSLIKILDEMALIQIELKPLIKGVSNLSKKTIDKLNKKISRLQLIIKPFWEILIEDRTAEQTVIYEDTQAEIIRLRKILWNSYEKDTEVISSLQLEYSKHKEDFISKMKKTKSSDIFTLIEMFRIRDPMISELSFFKKDLLKQAEIEVKYNQGNYLNIIVRASVHLFACALGYPCDGTSQMATYNCIIVGNNNACNSSVEDFYLNNFISPNLHADVSDFINFMFNNYAK